MDDLSIHPTVKPVGMIADVSKECGRRGEIVPVMFARSGSTVLAAERVGRKARAIKIEPRYVDVTIRRWQTFTGQDAVQDGTRTTFDEVVVRSAAKMSQALDWAALGCAGLDCCDREPDGRLRRVYIA